MGWSFTKLGGGLDGVDGDLEGLEKDVWEIEGKGKKRKLTTSDTMTLVLLAVHASFFIPMHPASAKS